MTVSLKDKIIKLRKSGKTYDEIKNKLKCSKATISYHCRKNKIGYSGTMMTDELIDDINKFYKNNTLNDTAKNFNIGRATVIKYTVNKRKTLSDLEKKERNYLYVKTFRQRLKEKAVKYKGGKCEIEFCGYDKCIWALDFHHKDPNEKDFNISSSIILKWELIKKELDKCIMVCSNCHREIHYKLYKVE